jgi:hypothetical protein
MKPTAKMKKQHAVNSPAAPRRVPVEFIPQPAWPVEIGRVPVKTFAASQTMRDKLSLPGYKRPHGSPQPAYVFVPIGLLDDAANQRASSRPCERRATLPLPVNLEETKC